MTCPLCAHAVKESVGRLPAVGSVEVDLAAGRVRVQARQGRSLEWRGVKEQIARSGFSPAEEPVVRAGGVINVGLRGRMTFRVSGTSEDYVLLEGEELRRFLGALRGVAVRTPVVLTGRIHRHPERLPPSLSVLSYEVKTP